MAEIVLAAGTSHSVLLASSPDLWAERAVQDRHNTDLYDETGRHVTYDERLEQVADRFAGQFGPEEWKLRWKRCQMALDRLRDAIMSSSPDVVVVVGDDQRELFDTTLQPAFAICAGDDLRTGLFGRMGGGPLANEVARNYLMHHEHPFRGHSALAKSLISSLVADEIDVTYMDGNPKGAGFGHAYGFLLQRLLQDLDVPLVPVMLNTYYPPNQPTPSRCYDIGKAVARAIQRSDAVDRVALIASGGLSHFLPDEKFDHTILSAIANQDADTLCTLPEERLRSGSSEIRNWITVAGAVSDRNVLWSDYVPIYRTPAGTGCAMGFLLWDTTGA